MYLFSKIIAMKHTVSSLMEEIKPLVWKLAKENEGTEKVYTTARDRAEKIFPEISTNMLGDVVDESFKYYNDSRGKLLHHEGRRRLTSKVLERDVSKSESWNAEGFSASELEVAEQEWNGKLSEIVKCLFECDLENWRKHKYIQKSKDFAEELGCPDEEDVEKIKAEVKLRYDSIIQIFENIHAMVLGSQESLEEGFQKAYESDTKKWRISIPELRQLYRRYIDHILVEKQASNGEKKAAVPLNNIEAQGQNVIYKKKTTSLEMMKAIEKEIAGVIKGLKERISTAPNPKAYSQIAILMADDLYAKIRDYEEQGGEGTSVNLVEFNRAIEALFSSTAQDEKMKYKIGRIFLFMNYGRSGQLLNSVKTYLGKQYEAVYLEVRRDKGK
ncbi:hypothetical protein ACFL5G_05745 [Candidatus Margulisiibacteriota bacterium]